MTSASCRCGAGCRLQMGGSDQWGNIVNGIELARRMDGTELFGVTTPLITTADGAKMGKTASGAVWLNADQLPAYDYWQFWRNTADADVVQVPASCSPTCRWIGSTSWRSSKAQAINEAKIVLANEATAMLHGARGGRGGGGDRAADLRGRRRRARICRRCSVPEGSIGIVQALTGLGFAASNGEARRKIAEGAVSSMARRSAIPQLVVDVGDEPLKLSLGKKKHGLLIA